MPGTLNRRRDDALLDYLHPMLEERFGVLTRTPDFAKVDFANAVYLIEVKGRTGRAAQYESFRLARRKFNAMRRLALEMTGEAPRETPMLSVVPIIVWAFSDEVLYADLWTIAPDGYEIPWAIGGRFDRKGTARAGAHDLELVWDVPRALAHTLVAEPRWCPTVVVPALTGLRAA